MTHVSAEEALDLVQLISGVNRKLEQIVETKLKPARVPNEQFRVLRALDTRDGQTMGELAAHIFVDNPTLTKIIDRMIASALVYRAPDPGDRRKVLVFLSDGGRFMLKELCTLIEDPSDLLTEGLGPGDVKTLRHLLESLLYTERVGSLAGASSSSRIDAAAR